MTTKAIYMTERQNVTQASQLLRELQSALSTLKDSDRGDAEHALAKLWNTHVETLNGDRYQGWTNRETWAAWVNITNDVDLYRAFRGSNAEDLRRDFERVADAEDLLSIGSLWRVNWDEIAKALSDGDDR